MRLGDGRAPAEGHSRVPTEGSQRCPSRPEPGDRRKHTILRRHPSIKEGRQARQARGTAREKTTFSAFIADSGSENRTRPYLIRQHDDRKRHRAQVAGAVIIGADTTCPGRFWNVITTGSTWSAQKAACRARGREGKELQQLRNLWSSGWITTLETSPCAEKTCLTA